jgi:plasmid stabilization system protein ParE
MTYRVELTARASRTLKRIFRHINAKSSPQAFAWFNQLEAAILSLDQRAGVAYPAWRAPAIPETAVGLSRRIAGCDQPALRLCMFNSSPAPAALANAPTFLRVFRESSGRF